MKPTGLFWWIDRWRKSSAYMDMTLEEQGAYRNLLDEAHLRGVPLPNDERILAKACGDATAWPRVRVVVMQRFTLQSDGWHNETMDEVYRKTLQLSEERSKAGIAGNRKRWGKDIATPIAKDIANASSPSPSPSPSLSPSPSSLVSNNKLTRKAIAANNQHGHNGNGSKPVNGRSRRPIFSGQRFVVFDWMLDDLERTLGTENAMAFDLHEWFFSLDAQAAKDGHVIPRTEQWNYLQAALLAEAKTRGLSIVTVPDPNRKLTPGEKARQVVAEIDARESQRRKALS